jgi:hypothetical protein
MKDIKGHSLSCLFIFVKRVLIGKPEGKKPVGSPSHRWEDGIRMNVKGIGWGVWSGFSWLSIGTGGGLM